MTTTTQKDQIKAAMKLFPATFGMRAFPGDTFRISERASYVSEGRVMLYTEIQKGSGWDDFCKGTISELASAVVVK